jgi:hypothetical protein
VRGRERGRECARESEREREREFIRNARESERESLLGTYFSFLMVGPPFMRNAVPNKLFLARARARASSLSLSLSARCNYAQLMMHAA